MFFLPPEEFWFLTVARLKTSFDSNTGTFTGTGTGFFVYDLKNYFLVTARHVVDPTYTPAFKLRQAEMTKMEFSFQSAINAGTPDATVGYEAFSVTEPNILYDSNDVDVAVIKIPDTVLPILTSEKTLRPFAFKIDFLANEQDLAGKYAGEPVVFVGFPDNAPVNNVGETEFYYPLLRQGVFAYPPIKGIRIDKQLGRNYGLIDSYAQSGFSGGPIVSLQKGWADGSWHPKEDHKPPKLVGLVCGHYRSAQDRADGGHAGLSFFARSTSILSVIEAFQRQDC